MIGAVRRFLVGVLAWTLACGPVFAAHPLGATGVLMGRAGVAAGPSISTSSGLQFMQGVTYGAGSSLNIGSPKQMTFFGWIWGSYASSGVDGALQNNASQFRTTRTNLGCEVGATTSGMCAAWDNSAAWPQITFASTAHTTGVHFAGASNLGGGFVSGKWNHYLVSFDTVTGAYGLMVNDVDVIASGLMVNDRIDANVAIDMSYTEGFGLANWFAVNGRVYQMDAGFTTESIACTGVGAPFADCTGAHTLSPGMVAKFINTTGGTGGVGTLSAADLGINCVNASPTSTQPAVCIRDVSGVPEQDGSAAPASPFATQATSPTTVTTPYIVKPPYSPTGPAAHIPYLKWSQEKEAYSLAAATIISTAGSFTVSTNDFLVLVAIGNDTSGTTDHLMTCPSGGATTWTTIKPALTSVGAFQGIICYGLAGVGETGGETVTFTGTFTRLAGWALYDYGNVNTSTPVDTSATSCASAGSASTTASTPSNTTTAAGETILNLILSRAGGSGSFSAPSAGATRTATLRTGTRGNILGSDQMNVANGAQTQVTMTINSEATIGCNIVMKGN